MMSHRALHLLCPVLLAVAGCTAASAGGDPMLEEADAVAHAVARLAGEEPPSFQAALMTREEARAYAQEKMESDPSYPRLPYLDRMMLRLGLLAEARRWARSWSRR